MHGQQLHAIAAHVDAFVDLGRRRLRFVAAIEPTLFDGRRIEVVEERGDADVVAAGGELGGDIDQAVEIGPRSR